ncbi:MAG TPA: APC family permease, partial [Solirubrobacteraceae bacterium]|nr:APC family permease [Solirubrobacteraceae bacterium]
HEPVVLSPATGYPTLGESDLEVLRGIGRRWEGALGDRAQWIKALPCDPNLGHSAAPDSGRADVGAGAGVGAAAGSGAMPGAVRLGRTRFVPVEVDGEPGDELEATRGAGHTETLGGWTGASLRRALLGPALHSAAVLEERMRKLVALPVLSSDALSSVAYGPEAMLVVLALGGAAAFSYSLGIAGAIVVLMVAVGLSYRQTIRAYPRGGGSYIVASDNLGLVPGLVAAAGLMLDYILTVAVSVASGIAAVTSAIPSLSPDKVELGLAVIAILVAGNLRGVRQAGMLFAAPTYMFIVAILLLVAVGVYDAAGHGFHATPRPPVHAAEGVGLLLILRAFGSGATAMTGIEAISDGIPAFRPVEWRNARTTLTWMVSLLVVMFVGTMALIELDGIVPSSAETVLSQLAHVELGNGLLYGYVQAATALVLLLAANTAFSDFPRLLFFLARDYSAPRLFLRMGDRLAFSNGIVVLGAAAAAILAAFGGSVISLIPLFAVGVFLAFTLSQTGMVMRWLRTREPGWRVSICFNALGAFLSAIVLIITAFTKFLEGAWLVVVLIPLLVALFLRIRTHYLAVGRAVALHPVQARARARIITPPPAAVLHERARSESLIGRFEQEEAPDQVINLTVVPIIAMDLASLRALAYAASLGQPVLALHVSTDPEEAKRFRSYWHVWGDHVPLEIVLSPYRALVAPLARYLRLLHDQAPDFTITVVLPELIVRRAWHRLLHNGVAPRLRRALRRLPGIVVTTVPFHLPG